MSFLLFLLVIAGTWLIIASPSAQAYDAPTTGSALVNLDSCYSQTHKMAVVMLMDETGSLEYPSGGQPATDPQAKRVDFAQSISQQLAILATGGGGTGIGGGEIDAEAIGFADGPKDVVAPWTQLNAGSIGDFAASLSSFRTKFQGQNTDYVSALQNAQSELIAQAGSMSPQDPKNVCQVIVWLTDGKMDFSVNDGIVPSWLPNAPPPRSDWAGLAQGYLCGTQSIVNTLRSTPTFLLTVGLSPDPGTTATSPQWADLRAITTNDSGQCGAIGTGPQTGFFTAGQVRNLISELTPALMSPPGKELHWKPCSDGAAGCEDYSFSTFGLTSRVTLLVNADKAPAASELSLIDPSGGLHSLSGPAGSSSAAGATLVHQVTASGSSQIDILDFAGPPTAGAPQTWSVRYDAPGSTDLPQVFVSQSSGVELAPTSQPKGWILGSPTPPTTLVLRRNGAVLPAQFAQYFSAANASASAGGPYGDTKPAQIASNGPGRFQVTFTPTAQDDWNAAGLMASVTAAAPPDVWDATTYGPLTASWYSPSINIVTQGPSAKPLNLASYTAQRSGVVKAGVEVGKSFTIDRNLEVHGSSVSGKYCVHTSPINLPSGVSGSVDVKEGCIAVPAGAIREIPVAVHIENPTSGVLAGVTLAATSVAAGQSVDVHVPVTGAVIVPPGEPAVNQATFWGLIVASIVGALLLWFLACLWTSKLAPTALVRVYRKQITVRPLGGTDMGGSERHASESDDRLSSDYGRLNGSVRTRQIGDLELRAPVRMFRPQDVVVSRPGHLVHGSLGADGGHRTKKGRIAHQIQGQWALTVPIGREIGENLQEFDAELFLFVLEGAEGAESGENGLYERAQLEVSDSFAVIVDRLIAVRPSSDGPAQDDAGVAPERKTSNRIL